MSGPVRVRPVDWGQVMGHVAAGDPKGALRLMDRMEAESRGVSVQAVRRKGGKRGHDHWCPDPHDEFCPPSLLARLRRLVTALASKENPR